MSRPEASDNVSDYAPRGASDFYRHGRAGAAIGEGPKGDLSRLRQSLGPEPEVVHVPQPTRRVGWFASGFAIALVVGIVAGWLVISQFPSLTGKGSGSSTKTAELAPAKSPEEANAPGAGIANTGPRAIQSSAPSAGVPAAPATPQPANSAPARVATAEPAPAVRGVTDTEIRFGISAPFSGPAKELGAPVTRITVASLPFDIAASEPFRKARTLPAGYGARCAPFTKRHLALASDFEKDFVSYTSCLEGMAMELPASSLFHRGRR
jgi:hypothetical protein